MTTGLEERLDERTRRSIAAYGEHAREYQEALRLKRPASDVRRFAAYAQKGDLVLDAGCGPASDLRLLRDIGVHPVGVDLSMGALQEARMLMPRHPLVRAPLDDLPFAPGSFGGLWLSRSFDHLPRSSWPELFTYLLGFASHGPVYLSCVRGNADLAEDDDPILGRVWRSAASEQEVDGMFKSHGLRDVEVELRPDPLLDRRRPVVVALAHLP